MLFLVAFIFFTMSLNSVVRGNTIERRSTYAEVIKCLQEGYDVEGSDIQSEGGHVDKTGEKVHVTCKFFKGMAPCILRFAGSSPSTNEDILNFLAVFEWYHNYLATKSGVCDNMPYDEFRRIALDSGILKKENLANIEEDPYEPCAGDAVRKCFKKDEIMFENHFKDYNKNNAGYEAYLECFQNENKTCAKPILQHFVAVLQAFKRHMKEHQGKFGEKFEHIEPQPRI